MKKIFSVLIVAAFMYIPAAVLAADPDVVYFNGKITTLDGAGSTAEAVAVKDGKFVSVGSSAAMKKLAGSSTRMIDLDGKTVCRVSSMRIVIRWKP